MSTHLFVSAELGRYGFPQGHPLSVDRQGAFLELARAHGLHTRVTSSGAGPAARGAIERFHTADYVNRVIAASEDGKGFLDYGDTPAFEGCYDISAHVVGAALEGARRIMAGEAMRTFQPIGGLHHARRGGAAGFCVFNDPGVLIETLRAEHGVRRIAYVDIDVHHGDGVYYEFEYDPDVVTVDIHEDGQFLYPGTGSSTRPDAAPRKARSSTCRSRPGPAMRSSSAHGRRPSASSTQRGRSFSSCSAAPTGSPAIRSRTLSSRRPRMPTPRGASSCSQSAMRRGG